VIDALTRTQPTAIGTTSSNSNATASFRIRRERTGTWSSCQTAFSQWQCPAQDRERARIAREVVAANDVAEPEPPV
jgi:hypothetical protein